MPRQTARTPPRESTRRAAVPARAFPPLPGAGRREPPAPVFSYTVAPPARPPGQPSIASGSPPITACGTGCGFSGKVAFVAGGSPPCDVTPGAVWAPVRRVGCTGIRNRCWHLRPALDQGAGRLVWPHGGFRGAWGGRQEPAAGTLRTRGVPPPAHATRLPRRKRRGAAVRGNIAAADAGKAGPRRLRALASRGTPAPDAARTPPRVRP